MTAGARGPAPLVAARMQRRGYTGMTKRPKTTPRDGALWVALGAALWGTDTVLRRPLTASLSSYQIVFFEHLILTVILLPLWWRKAGSLTRVQWAAVLGIA